MRLGRVQWLSLKSRITLFTLAIFLLSLWSLSYYVSQMLRQDMQRLLSEQQFSTATFMAAAVEGDLKDRLDVLERIAGRIGAPLLDKPAALSRFLEQQTLLQTLFNGGVFVTGLDGRSIAAVPRSTGPLGCLEGDDTAQTLRAGQVSIGRATLDRASKSPVFVMSTPLRDRNRQVMGAVCGVTRLDLRNFLDKVTGNRYGNTGGYLLVAPKDRLIVTATDKSRIMEVLPAAGTHPWLDTFLDGYEGSAVIVNPRGVEVLASDKGIPAAGWIMAAVLPTEEAFAPLRAMQQRMLQATILLTVLAGILTWHMLHGQLSPLSAAARRLANRPAEPPFLLPLPVVRNDEIGQLIAAFNGLLETLAQREEALKESAALLNRTQRINRTGGWEWHIGKQTMTWTAETYRIHGLAASGRAPVSPDLIEKSLACYHPDDHARILQAFRRCVEDGEAYDFEVPFNSSPSHPPKWIRTSAEAVRCRDRIVKVVGNIADITERKQAENALKENQAFQNVVLNSVAAEIVVLDRDGRIQSVNERWTRFALENGSEAGRSPPNTGVGVNYLAICRADPAAMTSHGAGLNALAGIEAVLAGRLPSFSLEYPCHSPQKERWFSMEVMPLGDTRGGVAITHTDISAIKAAERALARSEQRLSLVLRATRDGFWDWDLVRNELYYSPRWWTMLGYIEGELATDPDLWRRLMHPDDLARIDLAFAAALMSGTDAYQMEFRLRCKDGKYATLLSCGHILRDGKGKAIRVSGAHRDITARKRAEEALREQEEFFRLIAENLEDFVTVLNLDGQRVYASPSYARLLGKRELSGTSSFEAIHPADRDQVVRRFRETADTGKSHSLEYRFLMNDGSVRFMESRGGVIKDNEGRIRRVVVVSHDVTERRAAEDRIHHLAFHDALTHLPNRLTLRDRLSQAMAASKRTGRHGALMFVDLDNFKPVNDTHGHEAGDSLLIEAANRLQASVRAMDTVVRFGGDEFVVLLSTLHADLAESTGQARLVAEKIRLTLSAPYLLTIRQQGKAETIIEHHCTASIGIALFSSQPGSRDDLLKWADAAMYQAKEEGPNLIRFHDPQA
ncbi:MAG: PAS domain S-box protein [Candidatus Accumulibacter sp. UW26]|jgi:diguanylate cyclase (GGDEF)-like protein/PAS domain S-box-containing protein